MRTSILVSLALASCAAAPQGPRRDAPLPFEEGYFQVQVGVHELTDDDLWAPAEDQSYLGLAWGGGSSDDALAWDVGFSYSEDDGVRLVGGEVLDVDGSVLELSVGALAALDRWRVRPYVGLGVSLLHAEADVLFEDTQIEDADTTFGGYVRAGLMIPFQSGEFVGFDVRHVFGADVQLGPLDGDADGTIFALTFGYGF